MTTTIHDRNSEIIGDIDDQLTSIFLQNAQVYYDDDSGIPRVPADQLLNIIAAYSETYGVKLMSDNEYQALSTLLTNNPNLAVSPEILAHFVAERAPQVSDSPERPGSRPPSRGPPQTPLSGKGPSVFETSRRQRSTPLDSQGPPSSWAKRPPPSRRKSDAGSRSDSESYTSPPNAYGRSRAPSNPVSPSTMFTSLGSPTFSQTPSRPHSRQSHSMIGSPELIQESHMQSLGLFGSEVDLDSDEEEVHLGLIHDRGASASTLSLLEQADHDTLQRENNELKKKLLEAESTLQNRLVEHDMELEELQAKLDEMRSELNAAKREEKELRSKERQNSTQIAMLESEISKVSDQLRNAKDTYSSLQRQYQEQCSASERYRDDLRKREETIRNLKDAVGLHEHDTSKWAREQQHYEERISQLDAELAIANQLQAELDAQKQENMTLKETIDRLHFELDEQRNVTIQGATVGANNSAPGTLSKSLGAELAKNGWGDEEEEEVHVNHGKSGGDVSFDLESDSTDEEDFIETIVTRRRKVASRANKLDSHTFEEVKEYSDAFTQHESSEFTSSCTTQTDPEPVVRRTSFSIQTEEAPSRAFAIQTEPESEPMPKSPKVTFDIDIQTDYLEEVSTPSALEVEEPVASTSSSSSSSNSTATPSTPKAKMLGLDGMIDEPPAYTQVPRQEQEWHVGDALRKWHPGLSSSENIALPGPVSLEAIEEWKALKEELGIDCLVIDKLLASAERASPRPSQTPPDGKPIRRGKFYNIYNTYVYGQSSSLNTFFTMFGVSAIAFLAGIYINSPPQYTTPGQIGAYDRALWKTFNSMSPAGEGFALPADGTSAVWSILGRVGGGAARIARGWPT
ncbi:hypothetical protein BDN71DRAFT_1396851 [Pleurotus eryngii]|uniref:Uncharacterized protein n=1 Tax=Pleurotus eryngii TaxID=5323 RepID=A0A9P5ZRE8_PLEER|nr:hypothetical protein BDN71DRAFT_1396851 [Pleurotus eryngii]